MEIEISNELIEKMIKDQVDETVRKRIKEMQGSYTNKGFIEKTIEDTVWCKVIELCPTIDQYINSKVKQSVDSLLNSNIKITRKEMLELIVDKLLDSFSNKEW